VIVAVLAAIVVLAILALQWWFSLQLLAQNGRLVVRMEALEDQIASIAGSDRTAAAPVAAGLEGKGLPVGTPAPQFSLPGVYGETVTLSSLCAPGRRVLLVFSSPSCGPCEALAPTLTDWQAEHHRQLTVAVISSGEVDAVRAKVVAHRLQRVVIERGSEISDAYGAAGTPTAVLVSPQGLIESPVVGGATAIKKLVRRALDAPAARKPPVNPAAPSTRKRKPPAIAPTLVLPDLDGREVQLTELYRERTVVVFWNPGCGFCRKMLPRLKQFEDDPPAGAPNVVLVSTGDVDRNRDEGLRSPLLLDSDGEAKRAFGTAGTPTAVLIEQGRIASPIARGADAVLDLLGRDGTNVPMIGAAGARAAEGLR
jgi:methylamine dehydrogenase accessory protein MauD